MEPQTNEPISGPAMDFRTFSYMFRGRKPGMVVGKDVSIVDHEADKKAYEYYSKKAIDTAMAVQQPAQPPQFMSLTNSEGRVIDVLVKPDGTPQVVEPKTQNTQQGIMTMVNPTNAVPVVNPQTGQPIMGYAADPMMGDAPQTIGPYGAQPTQSPTPVPSMPSSASPAPNNMPMQFRSAEEVKAAYRSNAISREQAVGILANQFGIK